MAFGITREELIHWKHTVNQGKIAFLTHYWRDDRFPHYYSVTKVGCLYVPKLIAWGEQYGLESKWIHHGIYPHFDLIGQKQIEILKKEGRIRELQRFNLL